MLDTYGRKYVNPIIDLGANTLLKLRLTPNGVSIIALIIGVLSPAWYLKDFIALF